MEVRQLWHMDELELQVVGPEEVDRVVAAHRIWKLAWPGEYGAAKRSNKPGHLVDAFPRVGVEGDMVQAGLVNLERMGGEFAFRLPDVEGCADRGVDVDRQ